MKKEYLTPLSKIIPVFGKQAILGASVQDFTPDTGGGVYDDDSD